MLSTSLSTAGTPFTLAGFRRTCFEQITISLSSADLEFGGPTLVNPGN
jgi:hypothetical protein